jgi:hypothetical protein
MVTELARAHPRIWKFSHGTDKTTPTLKGKRDRLLIDRILTLYRNTPAPGRSEPGQGELFRNEMKPEDLFYLCHGNDVQLLGRVASDLLHRRASWPQRRYNVIKRCLPNAGKYHGPKKWWSPSGNTTCWKVQPDQLPEFEKRILLPFFGLRLDDISAHSGVANEAPLDISASPYSSPPPTPFPRRARRFLQGRSSEKSLLVFDPDRIGKRRADHEACLYRFAKLFPRDREFKSDYDLLVIGGPGVLLVEVKTLREDASDQLRLALGQLLCYEHFSVAHQRPNSKVFRLVVTDQEPPSEFVDFFEGYGIGSVWFLSNNRISYSAFAGRSLKLFGAALAPAH